MGPRLGRMRGSSASPCSSSGRSWSAQTPVALTTFAAGHLDALRPVSWSTASTPRALAVALEQRADLHAVGAHGAEALGLVEHRQHKAHVVGLAVVEQVPALGARARPARAGARRPPRRRDAVALGAPGLAFVGELAARLRAPRAAHAPSASDARAAGAGDRGPPTSRHTGSGRHRPGGPDGHRRTRAPRVEADGRGGARA